MHLLKLLLIAFVSCGLHAETGTLESVRAGEHGETIATYETQKGDLYEFVIIHHKLEKNVTLVLDGTNVITWDFYR